MKKIFSIIMILSVFVLMFTACSTENSEQTADIQLKYTYDCAYDLTDSSVTRAYETLCEAVVKGEKTAGINIGMTDQVNQLFYTSFPLSCLVSDITIAPDKSGVVITYKDEVSYTEKVTAFADKVNEIADECRQGTVNDMGYVVNLYNYIIRHAYFDDDIMSTDVYSTIMNNRGTVFTYTGMFEYLLRQNDIKSCHVIATLKDGSSSVISGAYVDGELYYFDIGKEYDNSTENKLRYFGITTQELNELGYKELSFTNGAEAPDASDLKFNPCRLCKEWELKDGALYVTVEDGTVVEITQN